MMKCIDETTIAEAIDRLQEAAPGATIILFGSYARGDHTEDSDLDFLVIEQEVGSRHDEMVRLRDALRSMCIPVDIVIASTATFEEWADTPGTLYYDAKREGKVVHAA